MGDGGFSVNYSELKQLGQRLIDLRGEFDAGTTAVDPLIAAVADDELRGKLRDFADNWSDKKAQITKQLDGAGSFATSAADAYKQADDQIGTEFAPPPGGGH